jgi:probable rRNA maturation factor
MAIKFFFSDGFIKIPERKRLKQFIIGLFEREKRPLLSLTYIFCSDKSLLSINKEFLGHDDYTDIITFSLSDATNPIVGEIYISSERVKDNAKRLQVSSTNELHRVIFHGALHLCGYKDKRPADKLSMTLAEDRNLKMYFS